MPRFTYVYILQSEIDLERFYIGRTQDLRVRILRRKDRFQHVKMYAMAIEDIRGPVKLKRCSGLGALLKSASGRAFAKKRF